MTLSIDATGNLFWNDNRIDDAQLAANLADAARRNPQPELHLRAEKTTQYQKLAEVMAAAQNAGVIKIGFITEPVEMNSKTVSLAGEMLIRIRPSKLEYKPLRRRATPHDLGKPDLLGGGNELQIEHNGEIYTLRQTSKGKLILTK